MCYWKCLLLGLLTAWSLGCGTTAQRAAMEQLLVSDAVDIAVGQIDFSPLSGRAVYLDPEYVRTVRPLGFVNSDYIISSLRHQILASGCLLMDKKEDAEIVIEPRVGSLGTDEYNIVYGLPRSDAAAMVGAASGTGIALPAVPEIAVSKSEFRQGMAKLTVFAYRTEDQAAVWQSGVAKSTTTSRDTWVFGAGPFQRGSIYEEGETRGWRRMINLWSTDEVKEIDSNYLHANVFPTLEQDEKNQKVAGQSSPTPDADGEVATDGDAAAQPHRTDSASNPQEIDLHAPKSDEGKMETPTRPAPRPLRPLLRAEDMGQPRRG